VSLHYLTKLLPDLLNSLNTLYTRASNFTQEALPQLLMSESILRCGYLLSAMFLRNGIIDDEMLRALVSSTAMPRADFLAHSTETISLKKSDIATMLLRAIPAFVEDLPLNELLHILIGLASILSMIGMERKQAFILKELLQRITPGLIEARKVGAAEMGIHPAAGLLALSNASHSGFLRIEEGMRSLLELVGAMYGALEVTQNGTVSHSKDIQGAGLIASRRAQLHAYGSFDLKVDILKSCIAICEVLPDFEGILKYSVHLLHLSRRTVTLSFHEPSGKPAISQEEQTKVMNSIQRTVGAAVKLGIRNIHADYWDDFLVRGIEFMDPSPALRVTPRSRRVLQSINESEEGTRKDPFIYNPFSKSTSSATDQPLIAGDLAYFTVYLQNPFEIDVEIDEISLLTEGCDFQPSQHSIVLGHLCCQKFTLAGKPMASGTLKIVGCRAKIRYCKERDFKMFSREWKPKLDQKAKRTGFEARNALPGQIPSRAEAMQNAAAKSIPGPESDTLSLTVLNAQPIFIVETTTLSQPALMVLEGERKLFNIILRNESNAAPADLVFFTFQDSATTQLRAALMNKELAPTELYELQLQLAGRTPFKYIPSGDKEAPTIAAGGTATFTVEVLGIPGLLNGIIQVDYACLELAASDGNEKFYTRQLSFPVAVTVNAGIEVPRCNMLPFSGDFAWWNRQRASGSSRTILDSSGILDPEQRSRSASYKPSHADGGQFTALLARLGLGSHGDDHCLLLLDLRNVWPFPLSISVQVRESPNGSTSPTDPWRRAYTVHETLQPGHVSRAVLLIPRFYVSNPHEPTPLIGNQRQFVVSASKLSVEAEQANREAFWYREELLKHVRGSWREDSTGRDGTIDLRRGIRLNARMIDALRIENVEISLSINTSTGSETQSSPALQDGRSRFALKTNTFATLIAKIHNRSSSRLHVLLRVQPSLRDQPHNIALDLSKRFAWTGMLQRALHPSLAPDEVRETRLGITALCPGEYEVGATVEELKAPAQRLPREQTAVHNCLDDRRIWHAREPCLINAVDHLEL
jgi:trafficking protein particle complex subunit 9